jgi:hypothetical protein
MRTAARSVAEVGAGIAHVTRQTACSGIPHSSLRRLSSIVGRFRWKSGPSCELNAVTSFRTAAAQDPYLRGIYLNRSRATMSLTGDWRLPSSAS